MTSDQHFNFQRIARAIEFIKDNFRHQPDLNTLAAHVHLSPYHFQRMFTEWAGVSPKKYIQFLSIEYAKQLLRRDDQPSLFKAAHAAGLSGTGRLHDLFVRIEGMTPGEYKMGGTALHIRYSLSDSPFGTLLIASTTKGICHIAFIDDPEQRLTGLKRRFPNATLSESADPTHQQVRHIFDLTAHQPSPIRLHLKGTEFQLKVWEALLRVPCAGVVTYKDIATSIGQSGASRAVGSAIGSNPIAYLIPCHRVIQASGAIGGYMWGPTRKAAILGWEAAKVHGTTYP